MVKTWALHVQLYVSFPCQTVQIQFNLFVACCTVAIFVEVYT